MPEEPTGGPTPPQDQSPAPIEPPNDQLPSEGPTAPEEPDSFPRDYVEQLRREAAEHRTKAKRADELELMLLETLIARAGSGVLHDPEDVWEGKEVDDFLDEDGMPSLEKVRTAVEELVERKPHLAVQKPRGDIDQGAREQPTSPNLLDLIRPLA